MSRSNHSGLNRVPRTTHDLSAATMRSLFSYDIECVQLGRHGVRCSTRAMPWRSPLPGREAFRVALTIPSSAILPRAELNAPRRQQTSALARFAIFQVSNPTMPSSSPSSRSS